MAHTYSLTADVISSAALAKLGVLIISRADRDLQNYYVTSAFRRTMGNVTNVLIDLILHALWGSG